MFQFLFILLSLLVFIYLMLPILTFPESNSDPLNVKVIPNLDNDNGVVNYNDLEDDIL